MASIGSVLGDIGKGLKKFFSIVIPVAQAAEPFIDVIFPGVAPLFDAVVAEAAKAEALAVAAGEQNGTGAQKLALVVGALEQEFAAYEKANGLTTPLTVAQTEAIVNAAVAFLNALPSSTIPAPAVAA